MIQLPFPPGTVRLKCFWFVVSLLIGLSIGIFCQLAMALDWLLVSGWVVMVMFLPGLVWPDMTSFLYRVFNKSSRVFSQQAITLLVAVCFAIISVAVGRQASALRLASLPESHSLWQAKGSVALGDQTIGNGNGVSRLNTTHQSWGMNFLRWTLESGNWWMGALLPFLLLISIFGKDQEATVVSGSVYTLY
ncbi:hypothetical protein [Candidatus Nitrospira salsa]